MIPFEAKLGALIDEEIDRLRQSLETQGVVQEFADYKFIAGQIFALKLVSQSYFQYVNDDLKEK